MKIIKTVTGNENTVSKARSTNYVSLLVFPLSF